MCNTFYSLSHLILTITLRSILLLSPFKGEEEVKNLSIIMCSERRTRKKRPHMKEQCPPVPVQGENPGGWKYGGFKVPGSKPIFCFVKTVGSLVCESSEP